MILDDYEEVRETSVLMLQAARHSNWEALVAGEQRCAAVIGRMQSEGDDPKMLDGPAQKRAHELIRAILAHDAEIRDLTQPWLRQMETYMGSTRMARRVAAIYLP